MTLVTEGLRNPVFHCRIHKIPPLVPIYSHTNPVYALPVYVIKINFYNTLPSTPRSFKCALSIKFPRQNAGFISLLSLLTKYVSNRCPLSIYKHITGFSCRFLLSVAMNPHTCSSHMAQKCKGRRDCCGNGGQMADTGTTVTRAPCLPDLIFTLGAVLLAFRSDILHPSSGSFRKDK